jgi:hypothetical protein
MNAFKAAASCLWKNMTLLSIDSLEEWKTIALFATSKNIRL